jgi:hypothetical protein
LSMLVFTENPADAGFAQNVHIEGPPGKASQRHCFRPLDRSDQEFLVEFRF